MKKQILILLIGIFSLLSMQLNAQFTKQQAINLVLNQILANELDHVDVYMSNTTISNQSVITLMNNTTVNPVYANNWICFVDDLPFAGSDRGAQRAAMFYSFFGTCKKNNVNPFEWLKKVLDVIPTHKVNKLHELLPQNLDL